MDRDLEEDEEVVEVEVEVEYLLAEYLVPAAGEGMNNLCLLTDETNGPPDDVDACWKANAKCGLDDRQQQSPAATAPFTALMVGMSTVSS